PRHAERLPVTALGGRNLTLHLVFLQSESDVSKAKTSSAVRIFPHFTVAIHCADFRSSTSRILSPPAAVTNETRANARQSLGIQEPEELPSELEFRLSRQVAPRQNCIFYNARATSLCRTLAERALVTGQRQSYGFAQRLRTR